MTQLSRKLRPSPKRPVKVLQFGEGNFLRAFIEPALYRLNQKGLGNAGVAVAVSIGGGVNLMEQDGLYTLIESSAEGMVSTLIDVISAQIDIADDFETYLKTAENPDICLIASNTTEAGITYCHCPDGKRPETFPARLAAWLKRRFDTAPSAPTCILPCELIEKNGEALKGYILKHASDWAWPAEFSDWIKGHCRFYNTLVDRIVPGFPKKDIGRLQTEWGYADKYSVLCESFYLFAIEGDTDYLDALVPFSQCGLDLVYTKNLAFYRTRKVAVLNGAHTASVALSLLLGKTFVEESLHDEGISQFILKYLSEDVAGMLQGGADTKAYIEAVLQRFKNPSLEHRWDSIALNSLAKFDTRCLPTMLSMENSGKTPHRGLFALAALWVLYSQGERQDSQYGFFAECLSSSKDKESLALNLLQENRLYTRPLPAKQWAPIIAGYMRQLEENPRISLQNILNK